MGARRETIDVAVALGPRFSLISLAAATEVLRLANRELGAPGFHRTIVTADGAPVLSSSGIEIAAAASPATASRPSAVVVLTSYDPEDACAPTLLAWLRRQDRAGAVIAAADTGALLLARAGLLRDRRVAVHHEATPAYREALGEAILLDRLHAEDGSLLSSGGGTATVDMMLRLVARFRGRALADRVAFILNHRPLPERAERPGEGALARVDRRLGRMVEIMQNHLDQPLAIEEVCRLAGVEPSTARRLFRRRFGESPGRYYRGLRLQRARLLLGQGALSVGEIAAITGFGDPSSLTRAYRRRFAALPSAERRMAAGS